METNSKNKGQAMIIAMILFISGSLVILFAISEPILHHIKIASVSYQSKDVYYVSEALVEDIIYRLNNSMEIDGNENLIINDATAIASITDDGSLKNILVNGSKNNFERNINTKISIGEGVSFNYGVQVGNGGFVMANNASVTGNVYSNGNITGGEITGTAIAANSSSLVEDQSNSTPATPSNSISFRDTSTNQDFSQSFQVSTSSPINKIQLYIKKVGNPANSTVRIVSDNGGKPGTTNLLNSQGTLSSSLVTSSYGWVEVVLPDNPQLFTNTTYWLVIDNGSQSSSNYYIVAANSSYSSGNAKVGKYSGVWNNTSPTGLDSYFKIFLGGITSTISNVTVGEDAWAHTITGGSISGTKYCQSGSGCNTTRPDPSTQGFPVSDANIIEWKEQAETGGTISSFTASSSSHLGPKKITGDLNVTNGSNLYIDGTVWVEGNINFDNGATVRLSSSFGSSGGVIISDGRINISNNTQFYGTGQSGSYILVITTSDCPNSSSCGGNNAINVSNNAGTVILNAQNGTLRLQNNAGAKEATANRITVDNGANVVYESGLINVNFSNGPGGSWGIESWREIE